MSIWLFTIKAIDTVLWITGLPENFSDKPLCCKSLQEGRILQLCQTLMTSALDLYDIMEIAGPPVWLNFLHYFVVTSSFALIVKNVN